MAISFSTEDLLGYSARISTTAGDTTVVGARATTARGWWRQLAHEQIRTTPPSRLTASACRRQARGIRDPALKTEGALRVFGKLTGQLRGSGHTHSSAVLAASR
jgi:hypothetical protein